MAHEITEKDTFGEVRSGGKRAWHGLGIELEEGLTVREGFDKLGLGWETELCPITAEFQGQRVAIPDCRAHIRCDTREALGVVSADYKPISNQQMAEFADALVGADKAVRLETGGSLRRGRRVFALIKLPRDTVVLDGDDIRNYVCISNGHDGLSAFRAFFTPTRVVCANTLAEAERALGGAWFAHDGDVTKKVELARAALGIVVAQSEAFASKARMLAKVQMTRASMQSYMDVVYARTFGPVKKDDADKDEKGMTEKHYDETMALWNGNLSHPRNTVKSTEGTLWHGMNAVTFYHDHQRGRLKSVEDSDARVHSNLFGVAANHKKIAFRAAMELATAK